MERAGQLIGEKYRLIHPLGMGGMGMVWRAEHETLKQAVALKLLRGSQPRSAIKRFQREAQIAASIRHRNIVYISDFGVADAGPYLVMELLQGVPLSERLYVGEPLSVLAFLALMDETLQGLAAVHTAGIVHRDMKPANIFLVREADGSVHPKLLDFGVSRSTDREQGHTITVEGLVMGTPEYISPEQARGKVGDHRSDLYSLGVMIYEALSGCLPFRADNPADLLVALLNEKPLPLDGLRPELGKPLAEVVMRAIERDPAQRYQSTSELRAALAACANDTLAPLALPKRIPIPRPTPVLSSAPPPVRGSAPSAAPPPRERFPSTVATEVIPLANRRRGLLLLATGGLAVCGLGLALASRAPSAEARPHSRAPAAITPPVAVDAGVQQAQPAPPEEPLPTRPPAKATTGRRARPAENTPRKGAKRELLRSPGF
ncbi:MAG TPA: protein kinase [Polyangiales bacterium]|nr:protein kinase [Polyangiales bacterium]